MDHTEPHFADVEPDSASRREFLKRSAALSAVTAAAPFALNLAAIGEAAAATASDYKALVCVFLAGGNDYANTVVPYDPTTWGLYNGLRSNLAYSRASLASTVLTPPVPLPNGVQYALAPQLSALLPLFNSTVLAPVMNVGTLVEPTTKAQYFAQNVNLPPKLFSHNDQQSYWQSSASEGSRSGWGGRMGELFASSNGNSVFTCIGTSGNAVFLSGKTQAQYQVTNSGSIPVFSIKNGALAGSGACSVALKNAMTTPRTHLLENELIRISKRSIDSDIELTNALVGSSMTSSFPNTSLASQLKLVAKLISVRNTLNVKRQVFFVSLGGFDNHDKLTALHPPLLQMVGDAMAAFYQSTVDMGIADKVTTFTGSDFGRTLVANDDGSDHGWGATHFVMGGAVKGKSFVGTSPSFVKDGPDDVGRGRILPTTSVDQMAATLGNWFGLSPTEQLAVLPNLTNFSVSSRNLGFMI